MTVCSCAGEMSWDARCPWQNIGKASTKRTKDTTFMPLLYIGPPVRLNCMNSRLQYHQPWHGRSALCAWHHAGSVGWNGGHRGIPHMLLLYAAPGVESVRIRLSGLSTRNRHLLKHARIDPALSRSVYRRSQRAIECSCRVTSHSRTVPRSEERRVGKECRCRYWRIS